MARTRTFRRGPRRPVDWSASASLTAYTTIAASTVQLLETFVPIVGGETVVRTRGMVSIGSDQDGANETQAGAFGICVVTAQAAALGITAIPDPITDGAWGGWFVHQYFANRFRFLDSTGTGWITTQQFEIDSKAMRKVDEEERVVVVVTNAAAQGMVIWNSERFLTKVH